MNAKRLPSKFLLHGFCCLLLSGGISLALAQDPASGEEAPVSETIWNCWYDLGTKILCRLAESPVLPEESADAFVDPSPGRTSGLPARGALPRLAGTILQKAARLRDRTISIPMYSAPEDMANAELLAESIMCGARSTCQVNFFRSIAMAAMQIVGDPALD